MTLSPRIVATPAGALTLRPEQPDDAAFLRRLFVANNAGALRDAGIAGPLADNLLALQLRSQTDTYRRQFPDAEFLIIEHGGEAIGRWIADDEGDAVLIVDFALLPEGQSRGFGAALMGAMMSNAVAIGKALRATVLASNLPSLRMCLRIGMRVVDEDEVYVHLRGPLRNQH